MKNVDNPMGVKPTRPETNPASQSSNRVEKTPATGSAANPGTDAVGKDTVSFSSNVDKLHRLEQQLSSVPQVNDARVETIKAAIAEGNYRIETQQLVDNLLNIERDLG